MENKNFSASTDVYFMYTHKSDLYLETHVNAG